MGGGNSTSRFPFSEEDLVRGFSKMGSSGKCVPQFFFTTCPSLVTELDLKFQISNFKTLPTLEIDLNISNSLDFTLPALSLSKGGENHRRFSNRSQPQGLRFPLRCGLSMAALRPSAVAFRASSFAKASKDRMADRLRLKLLPLLYKPGLLLSSFFELRRDRLR
jgi:hypothetical protein